MSRFQIHSKLLGLCTALTLLGTQQAAPGVSAAPIAAHAIQSARVVINIPSRTLWVFSGNTMVRYFSVGVGRVGYMTPLGRFSVIRKVVDPGWENPYHPKGNSVRLPPGEDNPLGTRWIGFYEKNGGEYGIHGTDNPASVGRFSSHGCVRMRVKDAEALFDMVDLGTPVEVTYDPVLVREKGNQVRVIVYADRFRLGMPSTSQVKAAILNRYPGITLDETKLDAALKAPSEQPVDVGTLPSTPVKDALEKGAASLGRPDPFKKPAVMEALSEAHGK